MFALFHFLVDQAEKNGLVFFYKAYFVKIVINWFKVTIIDAVLAVYSEITVV